MYLVSCTGYKEFLNGYLLQFRLSQLEIYPFEYLVFTDIDVNCEPILYLN